MQLDLFNPIKTADEIISEKANELLDLLNEGLNQKDKYKVIAFTQISDLIVLLVRNYKNENLFNVVDKKGNIPNDFHVNWRISNQVKNEVYNYLIKQKNERKIIHYSK